MTLDGQGKIIRARQNFALASAEASLSVKAHARKLTEELPSQTKTFTANPMTFVNSEVRKKMHTLMRIPRRYLLLVVVATALLVSVLGMAVTRRASAITPLDCRGDCEGTYTKTVEKCNELPEAARDKCIERAGKQREKCLERCGE